MTEPLRPDIDPGLRDDLVAISHWADPIVVPDPELLDAHVVQTGEPRDGFPWQRMLGAAAAVLVVLAGVWVLARRDDSDPVQPTPGEAAWVETAPSPLQPRNDAQAVWTGSEFIVFAGTTQPNCPVCDYAAYGETLHDAAAYDPAADSWRTIAPLPDDASYVGQAVVAGGDVYWFSVRDPDTNANGIDATLYRYRVQSDEWVPVPLPAEVPSAPKLSASGDALLLYPGTDEAGDFADWIWRPAESQTQPTLAPETWTKLPEDPFPQSYDRQYIDAGDRLLLFGKSLQRAQQTALPPVVQGASLFSGQWTVMPDSDQLVPPIVADPLSPGYAYAPIGGGADGGEINNWGRTIPNGGVYEVAANAWSPLPTPVPEDLVGVTGRVGDALFLGGVRGSVLDAGSGTYRTIPALPDGLSDGFGQALAAGRTWFFSFGGTTGRVDDVPATGGLPVIPYTVHGRGFLWQTDPYLVVNAEDQDALATALDTLGIDKDGAPDGALDLAGGRFCGYEEVSFAGGTPNTDGRACFRAALDGDTNAIFITQGQTTEGDPVAQVWRTVDGVDHVYSDGTRDKFGSGGWSERQCTLIATDGYLPFGCQEDGIVPASDPTTAPSSTDSTVPASLPDEHAPGSNPPSTDDAVPNPTNLLVDRATEALCDEAIRLLDANGLSDPRQLVTDLRALSTDGLPPAVAGGFKVAVDRFSAAYEASRGTLEGYNSEALSSFLTDTCGRGEIPTMYAIP